MKYIGLRLGSLAFVLRALFLQAKNKVQKPETKNKNLLGSLDVPSFCRINANSVAFIDERRHRDDHSVFESGGFVDVGNSRALQRWFGLCDCQFHRGWQIDADRRTVVKLCLDLHTGS